MLFCYDISTYQSKDGKPLNRLMASRGRSFKQTSLALVHEVGAFLLKQVLLTCICVGISLLWFMLMKFCVRLEIIFLLIINNVKWLLKTTKIVDPTEYIIS